MLRKFYSIVIICSLFACSHQKSKELTYSQIPEYEIKIELFYASEGEIIKYIITKSTINIYYNCDFENCKDTLLSSREIDTVLSKRYYEELKKIPLEFLSNNYINNSISDGLTENITFIKLFKQQHNITIHGKNIKEVTEFYDLTNSLLINDRKLRLNKNK